MPRPPPNRPTDAELEILNVLWKRGQSTVREVFQAILGQREVGYTTVLKFMQIMTDKGLLRRDETASPHTYRTAKSQGQTQKQLLRDLMGRAFDGSPGKLAMKALAARKTTPEEREQIRRLLDELEKGS